MSSNAELQLDLQTQPKPKSQERASPAAPPDRCSRAVAVAPSGGKNNRPQTKQSTDITLHSHSHYCNVRAARMRGSNQTINRQNITQSEPLLQRTVVALALALHTIRFSSAPVETVSTEQSQDVLLHAEGTTRACNNYSRCGAFEGFEDVSDFGPFGPFGPFRNGALEGCGFFG